MSGTTPAMYYWYFVEPNYRDLCEQPSDVRLGFNAAVSAFHMSDVFLEYYAKRDRNRVAAFFEGRKKREARECFLRHLTHQEPKFLCVQTAATVYKHLYTSAAFLDNSSPQSFAGVISSSEGVTIESEWRPSGGNFISMKPRSGAQSSLNEALEAVVLRLWPDVLGRDLD